MCGVCMWFVSCLCVVYVCINNVKNRNSFSIFRNNSCTFLEPKIKLG